MSGNVISVLGMHRSGTSVLTRSLEVFGVDLGKRLMPGVTGNNEKGFFEDLDFNGLNIQILETQGLDWDSLHDFSLDDMDASVLDTFKVQAKDLLERKLRESGTDVIGMKDPRMCRLLPFWRQVFRESDVKVRYLVSIRNPASSLASLQARDDIDPGTAIYVWLKYTLSILAELRDENVLFVEYERILLDPETQLERISSFLDMPAQSEKARVFSEEFLDKSLQHQVDFDSSQLQVERSLVDKVNAVLLDLARDRRRYTDDEVQKILRGFVSTLRRRSQAISLVSRKEHLRQRKAYWKELGELRSKIDGYEYKTSELENELARKESLVLDKSREIVDQSREIVDQSREIGNQSRELDKLREELEVLRDSITSLRSDIQQRDDEIERLEGLKSQLSVRDLRIMSLIEQGQKMSAAFNGKQVEQMKWIESLSEENGQLRAANSALLSSTSFKVTRPLRLFARACPSITQFFKAVYRLPAARSPREVVQGKDPGTNADA